MNLYLDESLAKKYSSNSQIARVLTESWTQDNIFCPNCGQALCQYPNNRPVADFYCATCEEDYELKSKKNSMSQKIVDGAYSTMIERLQSSQNPHFFFLNYSQQNFKVLNFVVIPKHFFTSKIIERRKALAQTARKAGWVGCNILINALPKSGKIFYIQNETIQTKDTILEQWAKTLFLKDAKNAQKGWLLDIMTCIEKMDKRNFTRQELLAFIPYLQTLYPNNHNIEFKISQQLQVLRDKGFLKFTARGNYELK